MLKTEGDETK